ncbi:hypothetical protein [Devosia riboflavina]|uniref:hypothetical protein n=1 Tax=Devosia riboflavina TaxID=46914 RepID=UPI0013634AE3|nr:hypothetical protein [Devosia riboflavina]
MDYVGNRVWSNSFGEYVVTLLYKDRVTGAELPLRRVYANAIEAFTDEAPSEMA